jgi:Hinge domain of cleavage stimulation factor subunit 2
LRSQLIITARQLLTNSPQLAYATFQAMLMMNLVDASVLQQVVATTGQPTQPTPPPPAYPPRFPVVPPANIDSQKVYFLVEIYVIIQGRPYTESNEFD